MSKVSEFGQKIKLDQIVLTIGLGKSENPKFAIIVPARFCPKATSRNKTKRLIWETLSQLKDRVEPGMYRILVKADFSQFKLTEVKEKLEFVFGKAGRLQG